MEGASTMNVIDRIQENYHTFSRTQKRIANFLLQNTDRACFLSLKGLSEEVSASEVTIIKFTRDIGFENYTDLKHELQQYVSSRLSPSEKIASAIENLREDGIAQIIQQDKEALESTLRLLKDADLKVALTLIKQSTRVFMVGDNISKIVTDFIRLRLQHLGLNVSTLDLTSYFNIASQLLHARKSDVFIVVSFPKYAKHIIPLTEYLHENDYNVICLTDRVTSPVGRNASVAFACATDSPVFYNSITAPIALANILVSALAVELRDEHRERRQSIDETSKQLQQKSKLYQAAKGQGRDSEAPSSSTKLI